MEGKIVEQPGNTKKPFLTGLAGLKFVAVLLMIYWHGPLRGILTTSVDVGARVCEFLFVVAGFLTVYNYKKRYDNIFKETTYFATRKLVKIWPLHFITFFVYIFIKKAYALKYVPTMIVNLLLLQSVFPSSEIAMSYNGISWFLSALFLCYLFTPLCVKLCKNVKVSTVLFVLLAFFRVALDVGIGKYASLANFCGKFLNLHTSFLVRFTEFLMGMLIFPLFNAVNSHINLSPKTKMIVFSIIEVIALAVMLVAVVILMKYPRAIFVVLWVAFVCAFAFNGGAISWLCSFEPVKFLSGIQLEFYMLHCMIFDLYWLVFIKLLKIHNAYAITGMVLTVIILISWLYKQFLSKRLETVMKKVFNKIYSLLKIGVAV